MPKPFILVDLMGTMDDRNSGPIKNRLDSFAKEGTVIYLASDADRDTAVSGIRDMISEGYNFCTRFVPSTECGPKMMPAYWTNVLKNYGSIVGRDPSAAKSLIILLDDSPFNIDTANAFGVKGIRYDRYNVSGTIQLLETAHASIKEAALRL